MQARIDQLLKEAVITLTEAVEVEFLIVTGQLRKTTAMKYLDRIESVRLNLGPRKAGHGVVAILGEKPKGSGRVIRTLAI